MNRTWCDIIGIKVRCMSWSLEYNEHLVYYETPENYYTNIDNIIDFSKPIIVVRIYYITAVGFMEFYSNTLQEMQVLIKEAAVEINAIDVATN